MKNKSLEREIQAAEKRLASLKGQASRRPTASSLILAEIANIEEKIACGEMGSPMDMMDMEEPMSYMDDDIIIEEDFDDDLDNDFDDDLDDDFDDGMSYMEMEEEAPMDYMFAADEGIEDTISQDYLSDVVELMGEGDLATEPSMESAARGASSMTSVDYLKRASARLDRVSSHLEKNGQVKIAFRLDKMADVIDARINNQETI